MTTKRILVAMLGVAMCAASASAAANLGGKKFYINPGHGGHTSNDRPTPMPLGVEMFYESDGVLDRGKHLGTFIKENGGAYKLSRSTNNESDDLALSTIAAQSNSYGGYFMSLHSNAGNASANYMVGFYRGGTPGTVSGAQAFTTKAVNWHDDTKLTSLTYTTPRALTDYSFYGYNLGVLRTNNRPGYLIETWFHDYRPEGLRMKSTVYNRFTAWQLCRAACDSPGASSGTMQGCIIGDIRDTDKSCGYTNYTTRDRDKYLAINGATVNLYNSAGTKVASMKTDNCANGVYGFFKLAAGDYTVEVKKSGYTTKKVAVTVSNGKSTKKNITLKEGADTGIEVASTSYDFGEVVIGNTKTWSVKVTGTGLSSAIAVATNNAKFAVSSTSLAKAGATLTITYTPTAVGEDTGKITLTSGSEKATISLSATCRNEPLVFKTGFKFGEVAGKDPDWLPAGGWSKLRNMDYGKGKLYIVNASEGEIYVVKAQTGELITKLNMTGVEGGTYPVMDVKVVGSKIIACNITTKDEEPTKVYLWENDYAVPKCILNTTKRGSVTRLGDTFAYSGNLTTGRLMFIGKREDNSRYKIITYPITDGVVAATPVNYGVIDDEGTYFNVGNSPRVVAETNDRFWVMGSACLPTLLVPEDKADGSHAARASKSINSTAFEGVTYGNDFVRFKYKGDSYALASTYHKKGSTYDGVTADANGQYGKMALLNGNNGWASAERERFVPKAGLGSTANSYYSTSVCVAVNGDNGVESWLLSSKQGLGYYYSGTVPTWNYTEQPSFEVETDASTDFGEVEIGKSVSTTFTVTGTGLGGDIVVKKGTGGTPGDFTVTEKTLTMSGNQATGKVKVTYTPTSAKNVHCNVRLETKDVTGADQLVVVRFDGVGFEANTAEEVVAQEFNDNIDDLYENWVYSSEKGNLGDATWFEQSTANDYTRDIAVSEDGTALYALNCKPWGSAPALVSLDPTTGKTKATLSLNGVSGGMIAEASIATLGNTLIMSNAARFNGYGSDATTDNLKVYRWDSTSKDPVLWLDDATHGSIHIGEHMSVSGNMTAGKVMFSDGSKILVYTVTNGNIATSPKVITLKDEDGAAIDCNTLHNGMTAVHEDTDGTFWVHGKELYPIHFSATGAYLGCLNSDVLGGSLHGTDIRFIDFGNNRYAAATTYLENATSGSASLTGGTMSLIAMNGEDGQLVTNAPVGGLGVTRNTTFKTAIESAVTNDGTKLDLYVLVPMQGIASYTFDGADPNFQGNTRVRDIVTDGATAEVTRMGSYLIVTGARQMQLYTLSGNMIALGTDNVQAPTQRGIYLLVATLADGSRKAFKVAL